MNLAQPAWLALLLLLPLLAVAAVLASRLRGKQWKAFVAPRLHGVLVKQGSSLPRWLALGALGLGCIFLIAALCRPQGDAGTKTEKTIGRNVLIALDLSRSMRVTDVSPDRLGQAKVVIYELLESLPNDRVGLIGFAGRAHLYAPLTVDHGAVRETVEQIDENWAPVGGSDLSSAVKLAIDTFKTTGQKNNALVILSDGEEHDGKLDEMIRAAEQAGVYIHAIGVGTEDGGFVPNKRFDDAPTIDRSTGRPVISRFHREVMQKLAQETKGTFAMAGGGAELSALVRNAISQLDSFEQKGRERKIYVEYYQWLLLPAILLIATSIILGTRWRKHTFHASSAGWALAFLMLAAVPRVNANGAAMARDALLKGRYDEATQLYGHLADQARNDTGAAVYRLGQGTSAYRNQDFRNAREGFSRALFSRDPEIRGQAHFGLGNTQFQLGWQGLTGKPFPTEPEQVPDLDRFETLVKEKLAELRQQELPDSGETELFRTFDGIIVNWTDAIRHYDSALTEIKTLEGPQKNRISTFTYLKRLQELLKEEEKQAEQAMQQAGMAPQAKPQEGEGDGEGEGSSGENGEDKDKGKGGDEDDDRDGKGGDKDKDKEKEGDKGKHDPNESPEDRARRLLKENSDMEKGPLNPGRREFKDPEKDW